MEQYVIKGGNPLVGEVGSEAYLRERFGFTPEKIAERVKEAIAKKKD